MLELSVEHWRELYSRIVDGGQYVFITISPKPIKDQTYNDVLRHWFAEFRQLLDFTHDIIIAIELTSKSMIHFHCMIRLWPIKNKYTFIRCFVNRWFHESILLALYGTPPTLGMDYLFKDVETTQGVLEIPNAVLNWEMLASHPLRTPLEEFVNGIANDD